MRLSDIELLSADYTSSDVSELAAVIQSTRLSSPSAILRWGEIALSDLQDWVLKQCIANLQRDFRVERITSFDASNRLPTSPLAELLVVRDLDASRLGPNQDSSSLGRIVAYADYRFTPYYGSTKPTTGAADEAIPAQPSLPYPPGFNQALHSHITRTVTQTMVNCFGGLPCVELNTISTLSPSHLRKGIAKRLTEWIFPHADRLGLPVVLSASPVGLLLYRKCGFVELRQFDVVVDLQEWGGESCHELVTMVRWLGRAERLPAAWRLWKEMHDVRSKVDYENILK